MKKTTQKLRYLEKKSKYFSKINKNALSGEGKIVENSISRLGKQELCNEKK